MSGSLSELGRARGDALGKQFLAGRSELSHGALRVREQASEAVKREGVSCRLAVASTEEAVDRLRSVRSLAKPPKEAAPAGMEGRPGAARKAALVESDTFAERWWQCLREGLVLATSWP